MNTRLARPAGGMLRRWALRVPLGLLVLLTVAVIVGPSLSPHDHETLDTANALQPPSLASGHWFGTDDLGRDLFTRVMIGGRISLTVGVIATLVSIVIGVLWGATAGYIGGRVDHLMMRIVDVLYAIPFMFFVILLMVVFGRHFLLIFVAIGAINWLDMARIVRGQTISLRQREFVAAAELTGVGTATIIRRHIVPNLAGVVVVYATLTMPQVILIESFLSFLGLGVQEPLTSWGTLVYQGAEVMELAPWVLLLPGGFLTATLYAFNFLGDGLRDAIDQRYQR